MEPLWARACSGSVFSEPSRFEVLFLIKPFPRMFPAYTMLHNAGGFWRMIKLGYNFNMDFFKEGKRQ